MFYSGVVSKLLTFLSFVSNVGDDLGNPELEWGRITIFLILALGVSFLCSLLEAIILSVTWSHIEILSKDDFGYLALIDPDTKTDGILIQLLESINDSQFLAILVGGSSIADDKYNQRLKTIQIRK